MGGAEGDAARLPHRPSRGGGRPTTTSDHATYTDADKDIADTGWWELEDRNDRRFVFVLHGRDGARRYALIDTGSDWLLHLTKAQPGRLRLRPPERGFLRLGRPFQPPAKPGSPG